MYIFLQIPNLVRKVAIFGLALCCRAEATSKLNTRGQTSYNPVAFGLGTAPILNGLQTYSNNEFTLSSSSPVLTLDYGADVSGWPYFDVTSLDGTGVQIELKYSEQFQGLNLAAGDGPW
jgi:hypothetical protein